VPDGESHGTMALYEMRCSVVFAAGTLGWSQGLDFVPLPLVEPDVYSHRVSADAQRITRNLLAKALLPDAACTAPPPVGR
jgi:hypothetical protein